MQSQQAAGEEGENLLKGYQKLKEATEKEIIIKFEKVLDKLTQN